MFTKEELLNLKLPTLPRKRDEAIYKLRAITHIVRSRLEMNGRLLIVAFYERDSAANGFSVPSAVLFQTKNEYITLLRADGREIWKKSRVCHAVGINYYTSKESAVCLREHDERRIRAFLPEKEPLSEYNKEHHNDFIAVIERYQTTILEKKAEIKKSKRAAETDEVMKYVPKLSKAHDRWVDAVPLKKSRYIYYRRITKKKAEGYCTHCKSDMIIEKNIPVHNTEGKCPLCSTDITYKATGKSTKVLDKCYTVVLQKAKNNDYLLRFFSISRYFGKTWREPETICVERARLFFAHDGTITGKYKHGNSVALGRYGWHPVTDTITGDKIKWGVRVSFYNEVWNYWFEPAYLYPHNLLPLLKQLDLSYGIKKTICGQTLDVTTYLMQSIKYPFVQILPNLGMRALAEDILVNGKILERYCQKGRLHACLNVPKDVVSWIGKYDMTAEQLNWLTGLGKMPSEEEYSWVVSSKLDLTLISELRHFTTFHQMKRYSEIQKDKAAKGRKKNQGYMRYGATIEDQLRLWKDYLQMAGKIGRDTKKKSVLFPARLQKEHDKVADLIKIEENKDVDIKVRQLFEPLCEEYFYESEGFLIRPPRCFTEFITEGNKLKHCVSGNGYYKKHVAGSSLIFFIRRTDKPEKPYYTVEYRPSDKSILQCYGYKHAVRTKEISDFIDAWFKKLEVKKESVKTLKVA